MTRQGSWKVLVAAAAAAAALVVVPSAAAQVANGGFETGDLSGWAVENDGEGTWFTESAPFAGGQPTPQGTYYAVSEEGGPATTALYQIVHLKSGHKALQMYLAFANFGGVWCTPPSLDFRFKDVGCNQQFRIDIMRPDADPFSLAPGDIVKNLYWSLGGAMFMPWTKMTFPIKGIQGDVMLRIVQTDNQDELNVGVDGVRLKG